MPNLVRKAAWVSGVVFRRLLARVPPGGRSWLAGQLMEDRFSPATAAMAQFCTQAVYAWKNKQYEHEWNGEFALLDRLRPFAPRVLVDVGANIGGWSLAACRRLPEATIHAFEIAPDIACNLAQNARPIGDRIVVNKVGLSDTEQTVPLYVTPEDRFISSMIRNVIDYTAAERGLTQIQEVQAQVTTGDRYLRQHDIQHVDMLKIDAEGAEQAVLRGFAETFTRGAIDLVQFEYGKPNIRTREWLGDFYSLFAELGAETGGYTVGKLFPEGVAFKPYETDDDDFVGGNYIACRTVRTDLIDALRCPVPRIDLP